MLAYHRITSPANDPWALCVSPQHFDEHLEVLQQGYRVLPLEELALAWSRRREPAGAIAITFDDGYADNLYEAVPRLTRQRLPATFFVVPAQESVGRDYWWDELEGLVTRAVALPRSLSMRGFELTAPTSAPRKDPVAAIGPSDNGFRHDFYMQVWRHLQPLEPERIYAFLEELGARLEVALEPRESHRVLRASELVTLADTSGMVVGSHTLRHAYLPACTPARRQEEIEGGKRRLEALLGRPTDLFCYPFGGADRDSRQVVARSGAVAACGTSSARRGRRRDIFRIPRLTVKNWSGEELRRALARRVREAG